MNKETFVKNHGNKKIRDVAGILHNYVIEEQYPKHAELENLIKIWGNYFVKDAFQNLENLLEFE